MILGRHFMKGRYTRFIIMALLGLFLFQGCAYIKNRVNDCGDMIDIGLSFSRKPQLALFYDFIPVIPIGYGRVDGTYAGLGGGKLSWFDPHFERSYGLILWGQEEVTFEKSLEELEKLSREEREEILDFQRTGLIGMAQGPFPGPNYLISCPHYIHLGWIGVVGSPRYLQMLDFVLGFTTLDIGGDDK
jgi:hypothetical protein